MIMLVSCPWCKALYNSDEGLHICQTHLLDKSAKPPRMRTATVETMIYWKEPDDEKL